MINCERAELRRHPGRVPWSTIATGFSSAVILADMAWKVAVENLVPAKRRDFRLKGEFQLAASWFRATGSRHHSAAGYPECFFLSYGEVKRGKRALRPVEQTVVSAR